ncbi:TetR/AcrR family transcriptional regulator [Aquincola sp. S2]|uniref:TetR/AcrR family transcriptional regulator n=1 Tax=Pseudaquabacterium terrae TaxID=2732868 RepID=A0ABX2ENJ9_9BURK|nr:TetR/AcrR family transcriptional regulator [Aquabacterium terrae]NRF70188.1 TetR/AcrR family transcriptional regulator [Aquabacterium terrae]
MPLKTQAAPPDAGPTADDATSARRDQILDAALALMEEHGYRDTTMLQIATRARASKNTLYQHFPTKQALFAALVARAAAAMNADIVAALDGNAPLEPTLCRFGTHLLTLLTGAQSLAINRAAIAEARFAPELAQALAANGRENTAPLVQRYFARQIAAGRMRAVDGADAIESFIGLLIGDLQVRLLWGIAQPPDQAAIRRRAQRAAERFVVLFGA